MDCDSGETWMKTLGRCVDKEAWQKFKLLSILILALMVLPALLPFSEVFSTWSYQIYLMIIIVAVGKVLRQYMGNSIATEWATSLIATALLTFFVYELRLSDSWNADGSFKTTQVIAAAVYGTLLTAGVQHILHRYGLDKNAVRQR